MMSSSIRKDIELKLRMYFDGLYNCDVSLLEQVFHPQAIYASACETPFLFRTMDEYFEVISNRQSPSSRGEHRNEKVVSIDMAGDVTALAKVTCEYAGRKFVDFLSFVKVSDEWLIISKVFHFDEDKKAL